MKMLADIDSACLKSTPPHLSVECKIAEPWVSRKPTIIVHEKMLKYFPIVTTVGRGATKSAAPVGKSMGKAQEM